MTTGPGVVDVVVVSYRCRELLVECLDSLAVTSGGVTVTVVDNASGDETVETVRAHRRDVGLVEMGRNAGFATAVNTGVRRGHAPFVLVLNPDTVLPAGAVEALVRFATDHPEAGVVAPRLRYPDGRDQATARAFPTPAAALFGRRSPLTRLFPRNRFSRRFLVGLAHTGPEPFVVDWVSGACMLLPRKVFDEVGGFDEGFFLFWEDADLCRRIADTGRQVWCVPSVEVVHREGGSRDDRWSRDTIRWFHQGAYRYWAHHHAPQRWNPARVLAAVLLAARAGLLIGLHRRAEAATRRTVRNGQSTGGLPA